MLTAFANNNQILIYANAAITGVNTSYIFAFENNKFVGFNTYTLNNNVLSIYLNENLNISSAVKIKHFQGGIVSSFSSYGTSIIIVNNTTNTIDIQAPTLFEIISNNTYNYTSLVYSNYITGITTQNNFPTSSLIVKRTPPLGKITINEGYLGPARVHRFAAISSNIFTVSSLSTVSVSNYFAFNYRSYGDHTLDQMILNIVGIGTPSNSTFGFLSVVEDYFNTPSQNIIGFSSSALISSGNVVFDFNNLLIPSGNYWFVFNPLAGSNFSAIQSLVVRKSEENFYTNLLFDSNNFGLSYRINQNSGCAFTAVTSRGVVIASQDIIYNQLNQSQITPVVYGDQSNYTVFTEIAVPSNAHYIKKFILDKKTPINAFETLIDSRGQVQYEVSDGANQYYSMIANQLTNNVVRYNLKSDTFFNELFLTSKGDYYSTGGIGNVLVSAEDFLGISTIEISTNPSFNSEVTTVINLANKPQTYIENVPFDFSNIGQQLNSALNNSGSPVMDIYPTVTNGAVSYILFSNNRLGVTTNGSYSLIYQSNVDITKSIQTPQGIYFGDTRGRIYNFVQGNPVLVQTLNQTPTAFAFYNNILYVGVSTTINFRNVPSRRRIFARGNNNSFVHQSWSSQISENEITSMHTSSPGLLIATYNQNQEQSKLYWYNNEDLTVIYQGNSIIDSIYYSNNSNILYIGIRGPNLLTSEFNQTFSEFQNTSLSFSGEIINKISSTKDFEKILLITNRSSYILRESNLVLYEITTPSSISSNVGFLNYYYTNNLGLSQFKSDQSAYQIGQLNINPSILGLQTNFNLYTSGYLVFSTSGTQSFYLDYPSNLNINRIQLDGVGLALSNNHRFNINFQANQERFFELEASGFNIGLGSIALLQGITSISPLVGLSSLRPTRSILSYYRTGGPEDVFGLSDSSVRVADTNVLSADTYTVYARFTDINGIQNSQNNLVTDIIYNRVTQASNDQLLPSGRIVEISPSSPNQIVQFVPESGQSDLVYEGVKVYSQSGVFESDPYYASDAVSWSQVQVLAIVPNSSIVEFYVKTADSLANLASAIYSPPYSIDTVLTGEDYSTTVASILADISVFQGRWIQYKLILKSTIENVKPIVRSVLITYSGAGKSVFVTKTFDVKNQTTLQPTPRIRRGILAANFVENGGEITFGYTTNPNNTNPLNYTLIEPNKVFELPAPAETIKFGVILKTLSGTPSFFDEFAVQLDLGPDNVYFMPPQASFVVEPYVNDLGVSVTNAFRFVNKTVGIVSSYNWNFGTTFPVGILTFFPPDNDPELGSVFNRQDPVVRFSTSAIQTVSLFVTGWSEGFVLFNSDTHTKMFIS